MKNLERRGFLGILSGSLTSALMGSKLFRSDGAKAQTWFHSASNIIENPNEENSKIKTPNNAKF